MGIKLAYAAADEDMDEEQEDLENMSKEKLMEHAKKAGVPVNDSMSDKDIIRAIKNAEGR